ncbi:MAG: hypothetical protein JF606_14690 [Burkholderiales bacterium]|nr:hypothetical protein [Burkholderiales bacterium]
MTVVRILLVLLLGLFMAGFGLCAAMTCYFAIMDKAFAWLGLAALLAALTVACFFGIRALLRANSKEE